MVKFPSLAAMHLYLKEGTTCFDSAGLPFYGSWRMKKQKVTMCKKHLFLSFSKSPPVPDVNVGVALWTLSGQLQKPILLLLSIPNVDPILFVHYNVRENNSPVIVLYKSVVGIWVIFEKADKTTASKKDYSPPKKKRKILKGFNLLLDDKNIKPSARKITSEEWLEKKFFSKNIFARKLSFQYCLLAVMIDFSIVGTNFRNPVLKFPYYLNQVLNLVKGKDPVFSMQRAFNYILQNFGSMKGLKPLPGKNFQRMLRCILQKEARLLENNSLKKWNHDITVVKNTQVIQIEFLRNCSKCGTLPSTTICTIFFLCKICRIVYQVTC